MENISAKRSYTKGITAIVISALGFAGMAFFVKLSGNVPIMQKAIFRNLITTIFAFFMLIKSKEKFYVAANIKFIKHIFRLNKKEECYGKYQCEEILY